MNDFKSLIEQAVRPLHASHARKLIMREEILAHLQAAYDQELLKLKDPRAAFDAARSRLGEIEDLRAQLQESVPLLERLLSRFIRKEILMSGWGWIVGWTVVLTAMIVVAPREMIPHLATVFVIGAAGIARLTYENNSFTRWLGPRWGWRILAVLFGIGIVLPALAKLKRGVRASVLTPDIKTTLMIALSLGVLMMLIGIASTIHSLAKRRSATA